MVVDWDYLQITKCSLAVAGTHRPSQYFKLSASKLHTDMKKEPKAKLRDIARLRLDRNATRDLRGSA